MARRSGQMLTRASVGVVRGGHVERRPLSDAVRRRRVGVDGDAPACHFFDGANRLRVRELGVRECSRSPTRARARE